MKNGNGISPHEAWIPSPNARAAVYMAVNKINGHYYIGFTTQSLRLRVKCHMGSSTTRLDTKFCRAISKYGRENFEFTVMAVRPTREEAKIVERQLITILKPEYNGEVHRPGKAIICLNDGREYRSAADAAKEYGLNRYSLACVANPKTPQSSIFGYKFKYLGAS